MACACGKGKSADGLASKRAATDPAKAQREAAAREQTATRRITPAPVATSGRTQSFALLRNGKTQSFGSRLERDAEVARRGGTPV